MDQVIEFFRRLLDSSDWPPRWHCGRWTEFHGWLYIISDLLIWSAYFTIPVVIIRYISKKQGIRFIRLYFLFAAFILACGATHFLDAIAFWIPAYRLNALVRLVTGILSWLTVFYLVKNLPAVFSLKSQSELEAEIEQRKKAEQLSRESEEQIQTIFNAAPDAVIVSDQEGRIIKWNPKAEAIFGWKKEEVTGRLLNETIIPERYREAHKTGLQHFLETGDGAIIGKPVEIQAVNKDNVEFDVALNISPTRVNNHYLFIGFVRDITEQKKAESKFRGLLESAPDAMVIADEAGRIVLVNQQTETLFGYTKEELVGQKVELLVPSRFQHIHTQHRAGYFREPKVRSMGVGLELFALRKDGTQFPVEISLSPLETSEGTLVSAAIRDITERKRNEALIRKQKQDIQDFIDSMSTLCAKVTTEGKFLLVNKPAMYASGLPMEELMNTNFLQGKWWTYDAEVHARVLDAFKKACAGTTINYDENIFIFGQALPINFSLIPIPAPDGSVDYIVAEGRDISALKQTEAALQKQTEELEKANKELEAFSYSVSHDLRAPLRIIDGYTGIMVSDYEDKLDEEGKRLLGIVTGNVRKMGQLIDDLLNLSRLGRKELIIQHIDMNMLVEPVISEQLSSITKDYEIKMARLEPAEGDSNLLRQVWINLISNAIKYSGGRDKPSIEISSEKTGNEIVYRVKDNGVGFNMDYAGKLFGVFQRLHKMTEFEGTGVGLALVHTIVTRHGGRVWADAEVNKGAAFYFSLPIRQDDPPAAQAFQTNTNQNNYIL